MGVSFEVELPTEFPECFFCNLPGPYLVGTPEGVKRVCAIHGAGINATKGAGLVLASSEPEYQSNYKDGQIKIDKAVESLTSETVEEDEDDGNKTRLTDEYGYWCHYCDSIHIYMDVETKLAYVIYSDEEMKIDAGSTDKGDYFKIYADGREELVWRCDETDVWTPANEFSVPEVEQLWACGDCGSYYTNEDDAISCCGVGS